MTTTNWPDTLELTLDGIAQGGEGVGRWEERVVFAGGGLPGERVRVRLSERRESYARGFVTEILESSPDRVAERLPGASHMPWQHIAYPAQLRFKRQILADQLAKIAGLPHAQVAETLPAPRQWGYRNSARFHGAGQRIGYHAADTRDIEEIASDPLLLPVVNDALAALREAIESGIGAPAETLLRVSETHGYVLAALRGAPGTTLEDGRRLAGLWRMRCPQLAGVTLLGAADRPLETFGADQLIEELDGLVFQLRPNAFFQVNLAAAENLIHLVREALAPGGGERLLDLYCGSGTFALPLAGRMSEVIAIEEHPGALADGQATAAANRITNVRFELGHVESALAAIDGPFGAVVLDPPRRGCHPQALGELLRLAPARIVYVSCHPATLARDLRLLVAGGYRVASVQPIDLFPQTAHIESVVVLHQNA